MDSRCGRFKSFVTFVYAANSGQNREVLWGKLREVKPAISEPCMVLGDLNVVLNESEKVCEDRVVQGVSSELNDFLNDSELYWWTCGTTVRNTVGLTPTLGVS